MADNEQDTKLIAVRSRQQERILKLEIVGPGKRS
jgi:hypothetical protein